MSKRRHLQPRSSQIAKRLNVRHLFGLGFLWLAVIAGWNVFVPSSFVNKVRAQDKDKAKPIAIVPVKHNGPVDFEKEILPIFAKSCLACHSQSEAEGGVILETPQTIAKSKDQNDKPIITAGKSAESKLLKVGAHEVEPIMPPKGNDRNAPALTGEQLGLIKLWIDEGAKGEVTGTRGPVNWQPLPPGVNPIYAVAVTPDGQYVAAGRANQIFIYHVPSGAEVTRLSDPAVVKQLKSQPGIAHLDLVQSLAFDPEGELLASGGFREVKIWRRPHSVKSLSIAAGDGIRATAVSPDRKWLATAAADKTIKLWSLPDGKPGKVLSGHADVVTGLSFLPDSSKLVSSSLDKTVRMWDLAGGKELGKAELPAALNGVVVAGKGTIAAAAGADNGVHPVTLADFKPGKKLEGHSKPVTSIAPAPSADDMQAITGCEDGNIRIINLANGQAVKTFNAGGPVLSVSIRSDGAFVAGTTANKNVKLFNTQNNQQVAELKGDQRAHLALAKATAALAKSTAAAAARKSEAEAAAKDQPNKDKAVKDATEKLAAAEKNVTEKMAAAKGATDAKVAAMKELEAAIKELTAAEAKAKQAKEAAAKDDKNKALADASEAAAKAAKAADDKKKAADKKVQDTTKAAEAPEKAAMEAVGQRDGAKKTLELAQADLKKANDLVPVTKQAQTAAEEEVKKATAAQMAFQKASTDSEKAFRGVAFSQDNMFLAAGSEEGLIHLYDSATGKELDIALGEGTPVGEVTFLGDGMLLSATNDKSGSITVWNTRPEWKLERTIGNPDDPTQLIDRVISLDFSSDGKMLATGGGEPSRSGELKIWNVADGKLIKALPDAHSDTIFGCEFSPDGKEVATCGADKFVKLWNVADGKFIRSFEGHTNHVLGVSWRGDQRVLASCGADNVIKIWDLKTGEQQRTIQGGNKQLTSLHFVGDTDFTVTSSGDGSLKQHQSSNGGNVRNYSGATDFMYASAATPDGAIVLGGGHDGVVRVWNGQNAQVIKVFEAPKAPGEEAKPDEKKTATK